MQFNPKHFLFLIIVLTTFSLSNCGKKGGSKRIETVTQPTEPPFKKEGVLTFFNANDTIKTIDIEIADNNQERAQGMMYRSSMDHNKGMLFIMDYEEPQSFWMKNCQLSLDIMYVNSSYEIVSLYKHTPPYSDTNIPSMKPALYVVETSAGFCDKFGVEVGNSIQFKRESNPI